MRAAPRLDFIAFAALSLSCAWAGAAQLSALAEKARLDFEKVDRSPRPALADALACEQSHAALLPVARADQRYLVHYRKGYCELLGAAAAQDSARFQMAAQDFAQSVASWPRKNNEHVSSGLRALMFIARLEDGRAAGAYPELERDLTSVITDPHCEPTPVMQTAFCNATVDTVRTWLAWLAYRGRNFERALEILAPLPKSPWALLAAGAKAQELGKPAEAVGLIERALKAWSDADQSPNPELITLLGPRPDAASVSFQLGLGQFALKRYDDAITTLDATIKLAPRNSHAIFVRARARDALGLNQPALADYSLAIQTARGADSSWAVGQAHYYRGLLLYKGREYSRAESEFSTALGARLGDVPQADVVAWRTMAAVAGGGCKASVDLLESALNAVSDRFPKADAHKALFDCRFKQAATLDQLLALERTSASLLPPAQIAELRARIGNGYAAEGVAAEDRKDPYLAVVSYRKALEWDPKNSKARFNLGAIYFDDRRYNLAETEYRTLVQADPVDYEAKYWLAQSILGQKPGPDRVAEACKLLRDSLTINDAEKKTQFAKTLAAHCSN